jgi:hypothetical protein
MDGVARHGVAAVRRAVAAAVLAVGPLAGCSDLQGFGGSTPPVVTFQVVAMGDPASVQPAGAPPVRSLQVALVWAQQWLSEPLCNEQPPESDAVGAVITAGCRDSFGFVPMRVGPAVPVEIGVPASISLYDLPAPDLLVGDVTSRVAYASMVLYDDRDGDNTLSLSTPHRAPTGGGQGMGGGDNGLPDGEVADSQDVVYGASFVTMTAPDQRVAYLEGMFEASAFYPRAGCDGPKPPFSVLEAGGFSEADGLAQAQTMVLPPEDPATCRRYLPPDTTIQINVQAPADVQEVACTEVVTDGFPVYRRPPDTSTPFPDLGDRVLACANRKPMGPTDLPNPTQAIVSGRISGPTPDLCKGVTHYSLRGCRNDVACPIPDWDYTAMPPDWWPCK